MTINNINISSKDGIKFSKLSGDNNKIHIDENYSYNSLYGHKIAHGVLLILCFLNKIKIDKEIKLIEISFFNPIKYNSKITIKKIKSNVKKYHLIQNKKNLSYVKLFKTLENFQTYKFNNNSKIKSFLISNDVRNKYIDSYISTNLKISLCYLSKYVGTVFPGENSLIAAINILTIDENNFLQGNKLKIMSCHYDKRFPLINNVLTYKNIRIEFKSVIRPKLNIVFNKPTSKIVKKIKSINRNILIIGSSSGIGNDLLKLFILNKKIKIIGTYLKNKLNVQSNKVLKKKIDIENDLNKIFILIKKYKPYIYYFATPKIQPNSKDKAILNLYRKYYVEYPLKIIKFANQFDTKFFYPSTVYLNKNMQLNSYTFSKLEAEKKIMSLKNIKIQINILRIPEINTRQNLSINKTNLLNFRDYLEKNNIFSAKVFFTNKI